MAERNPPTRPASAADQVDRDLAASALERRRLGQTPNARELAALRRIEKAREEQTRWSFYRTIPLKHWREMSGRQTKILKEQADLYGIPVGGPLVDLPAVARSLHDFLARNKHKLAAARADDPMSGPPSPALERWREEKYRLARLDRLQREASLVPRDQVHDGLARMAGILRTLGESIRRLHGPEAHRLVEEALDDWQRELDRLFGSHDRDPGDSPDA